MKTASSASWARMPMEVMGLSSTRGEIIPNQEVTIPSYLHPF